MSDIRKQIRSAVTTRLRDAATAAADRVFPTRAISLDLPGLPALAVYTARESISLFGEAPREYKRQLEVVVECFCTADQASDDAVDDLATQVEAAMAGFEYAEDKRALLTGVEGPIVDAEGAQPIGSVRLTYTVDYYTTPDVPAEEDFTSAALSWDLGPEPDAAIEAEDTINLPQE